jgi:WhiB family redox-sensing transcriptional regulator
MAAPYTRHALTTSATWLEHAACGRADPALFYPPADERAPERDRRERDALAVCAGCPVRAACAAHAQTTGEEHGIWGGTTEAQRARMRSQARYAREKRSRLERTGPSEGGVASAGGAAQAGPAGKQCRYPDWYTPADARLQPARG